MDLAPLVEKNVALRNAVTALYAARKCPVIIFLAFVLMLFCFYLGEDGRLTSEEFAASVEGALAQSNEELMADLRPLVRFYPFDVKSNVFELVIAKYLVTQR